ncbi:hypothetical protein [Streptomyces sp. LUP47B]|uniref:hypothetical protein n=1 Tax=Streptomyces TaxID=1883 RepID=UPI000A66E30D|nr:hypothetical protein [Streptomyces sp. LUP47B]WSD85444.1 hypothetical protein OG925_14570 [Streptomyces canus]
MGNTAHWVRGVVSGEDKPQVRTRNTPAAPAAVRDLIRSAPKLAGYVNTAAGRRAHTERPRILTLHGNHLIKPDDPGKRQGPNSGAGTIGIHRLDSYIQEINFPDCNLRARLVAPQSGGNLRDIRSHVGTLYPLLRTVRHRRPFGRGRDQVPGPRGPGRPSARPAYGAGRARVDHARAPGALGRGAEYTTELEKLDEDTRHPHIYELTKPENADQWATSNPMNEMVAKEMLNDVDRGVFVAPPA